MIRGNGGPYLSLLLETVTVPYGQTIGREVGSVLDGRKAKEDRSSTGLYYGLGKVRLVEISLASGRIKLRI